MNESPSQEGQTSGPDRPRRRGIFFRVLVASAAPVVLLAVSGILIARSLATSATIDPADPGFIGFFLLAAFLAVLLSLLLTIWIDFGLQGQLRILIRSLNSGRAADLRALATGDAWGAVGVLAEETQRVLARAEEGAESTADLEQLRAAADTLTEKVRVWQQTEKTPEVEPEGPLQDLVAEIRELADRLRDRDREARDVTEMTGETVAEAQSHLTRAGKETERVGVEVSSLLTDLGELRRISDSLSPLVQQMTASQLEESPESPESQGRNRVQEHLQAARVQVSALVSRLEGIEQTAVRAALQQAAGRLLLTRSLTENDVSLAVLEDLPSPEVYELRELAERGRECADVLESLSQRIALAHEDSVIPGDEVETESRSEAARRQLHLSHSLAQTVAETRGKAERLAALSERSHRQVLQASMVSQAAAEELQGLSRRFGSGSITPAPPSEPAAKTAPKKESARAAESEGTWDSGSSPLRLLTREDVLPESEGTKSDEETGKPGDSAGDA